MRNVVIGGIAALALAHPVFAQSPTGQRPVVITNPDWLRKPTMDQLLAVWPRAAAERGESGKAVIKCTVKTDGLLRDCAVVSEDPVGVGFGQAAIVLSTAFLMKPALRDGQPIESHITVPINFKTNGPMVGPDTEKVMIMGAAAWAKTPTVPEILAQIDKKVGDKFADGKVVLQCDVDHKSGKLSDCLTVNTSPGMAQFTAVARSLIPRFQVEPTAVSAIKDRIRVNLAFSFPDMQSAAWGKRYLNHPTWVRTVNPDPTLPLFPNEAAKAGLKAGSATVDCVVAADGSLTQCAVISESTPGVGFGAMAQNIAQAFATNPWTDDGLPAGGAHIQLPIKMVENDTAPPQTSPALSTPSTKP